MKQNILVNEQWNTQGNWMYSHTLYDAWLLFLAVELTYFDQVVFIYFNKGGRIEGKTRIYSLR